MVEYRTKLEAVKAEIAAIEARRCMVYWILGVSLTARKGVDPENLLHHVDHILPGTNA